MGETKKYTPIIHIIGPAGSGKTTLCRLFLDAFYDKSILVIDATEDGFLSLSYGISSPMTVSMLLQQAEASPSWNRESTDWALQDLPVAISTQAGSAEAEILSWGAMAMELTATQKNLLAYGLPRLFATYDLVIWDGPLGNVADILTPQDIQTLIVITPHDEMYCQQVEAESAMVLLSKAQAIDMLPPSAAYQIQKGNWKFLGKLPPLNSPERRVKELPQYFQDCFQKLDLPFELRPRFV